MGSTCQDGINDYICACPEEFRGVAYGGKNCTVELIGCQDHECQNNAVCMPFLVNEALNSHGYTCSCLNGFYGDKCELVTTASFSGQTWIHYDGNIDAGISLQFRTTLLKGLLMVTGDVAVKQHVGVDMVEEGKGLRMRAVRGQDVKEMMVRTDGRQLLANGQWTQVRCKLLSNILKYVKNCSSLCSCRTKSY